MILATHALTGAVIGKYINNQLVVVVASLIIHFLMDMLHHGEYLNRHSRFKETSWKVALDISIGIAIIAVIFSFSRYNDATTRNMIIGAFFSMFPDALTFLYWKGGLKLLKRPFEFHAWLHPYPPFTPEREWNLRNATNDIIISLIALILLII